MQSFRPYLYFGVVLAVALTPVGFGLWMAFDSMSHLDQRELRLGLFIFLFGPFAILVFLVPALNRFVPSERERLEEERKRSRPFRSKAQIQNLEKALRYAHGLKAKPRIALFFFLVSTLAFCALILTACFGPERVPLPVLFECLGALIGFSLLLTPITYSMLSTRWQTHFKSRISMLETRLDKIREDR